MLEKTFNVRNQYGQPIPYLMTDYQKEFHSESINIKGESAKDILFVKARGISFSFSSLIDMIYTGLSFDNQILPIITQRYDTSKILLGIVKWLIQNANADLGNISIQETVVKFTDTGSSIRIFPSGTAADAVRGIRLIRAMIDEYAFQRNDRQLLSAVQDTMQGKLAQILIGSTPCGMNNNFHTLVTNPVGFATFRLPVFDESKFNPKQSILEQDLIPIAPWIDLENLEKKRARDINIFLQEQMCDFLDDSLSFIPYSLVKRCEDPELLNLLGTYRANPMFIYKTVNPIVIGVDVARTTHLTAISAFEVMQIEEKVIHVQRFLFTVKQMEIPKQVDLIDKIIGIFPSTLEVRIDIGGLGIGLYEYLKKKRGAMIKGIQFGSTTGGQTRIRTGEPHQKMRIREYMIVNLRNMLEDGKVNLLPDETQAHHLTMVDYQFKVPEDDTGHADILFADALALLPTDYTVVASDPLIVKRPGKEHELPKDPNKWSMNDKIEWLKRQRK